MDARPGGPTRTLTTGQIRLVTALHVELKPKSTLKESAYCRCPHSSASALGVGTGRQLASPMEPSSNILPTY